MIAKGLEHTLAFSPTVNLIQNEIYNFLLHKLYSESASEVEPTIIRSTIEGGVKVVREFCCSSVNAVKEKKKPVDDFIATGIEHSQCKFVNLPFSFVHALLFGPLQLMHNHDS